VNIQRHTPRLGFSLLEILAVVTIIGIVAVVVLGRISSTSSIAKKNACYVHKGNVEVQAERWHRTKDSWPATNLTDIGAVVEYFPDGLPTCPVDGTSYTLDATTHRVIGHDHN
jgi:general secretion pathway protein G